MDSSKPSVAILMADYGHDPTETALPFQAFKTAGFTTTFFTEQGKPPECDQKMLHGWTGSLLGAPKAAVTAYNAMMKSDEWQNPQSWSDSSADLTSFDVVFVPGGHEKNVRQLLDSERAQSLMAAYWPLIKKPGKKLCGAVCHGVQFLAHTRGDDGKSVLHDVSTTALVGTMESSIYQATRFLLGDYYKTYGAGTPNVEAVVQGVLDFPDTQWKGSANILSTLVVEDEKYNYISARFPGDVPALAQRIVERVDELHG